MLNPHVLQKMRAEIDRVVGNDRLPSLDDRPQLRYIDYVVEETTRWRPLSPIGIPHKSLKEDEYNGMFIPKGYVTESMNQTSLSGTKNKYTKLSWYGLTELLFTTTRSPCLEMKTYTKILRCSIQNATRPRQRVAGVSHS